MDVKKVDYFTIGNEDIYCEDKFAQEDIKILKNFNKENRIYNILQYGCIGDGVTDNFNAFTNIINSVNDGDIIFIPSGRFFTSQPLKITKTITVLGGGSFPIKNWNNSLENTGSYIVTRGTNGIEIFRNNVTISGIGVDNIGLKNNTYGIGFKSANNIETGSNDCIIKNCTVNNYFYGYGYIETSFKTLYESCFAYNCHVGFSTLLNCTSITYLNCWTGFCNTGFWIVNMIYSTLINCACDNSVDESYNIVNSRSVSLLNCASENSQKQSLHIVNSDCIEAIGFLSVSGNVSKTSLIASTVNIERSRYIIIINATDMGDMNSDYSILAQGNNDRLDIFNNKLMKKINIEGTVVSDYKLNLTAIQ